MLPSTQPVQLLHHLPRLGRQHDLPWLGAALGAAHLADDITLDHALPPACMGRSWIIRRRPYPALRAAIMRAAKAR